jgi:4-hydroxy-2-oxoheptanedioate aldolase
MVAEQIGLLGFDFYMIDGEHGSISTSELEGLVRACESSGVAPMARIRGNDPALVLQYLDTGILGIMMPGMVSAEEMTAFVAAVKYPPLGRRGLGPVRAAEYMLGPMSQEDYIAHANNATLVLPQFEDVAAFPALKEIAEVEGVDAIVIGPRDLALSMGYLDGPDHPEVQELIDSAIGIILESGRAVGTVAGSADQARRLLDRGVTICLNSVKNLIAQSSRAFLSAKETPAPT